MLSLNKTTPHAAQRSLQAGILSEIIYTCVHADVQITKYLMELLAVGKYQALNLHVTSAVMLSHPQM